jgi:hypothetical protein
MFSHCKLMLTSFTPVSRDTTTISDYQHPTPVNLNPLQSIPQSPDPKKNLETLNLKPGDEQ